MADKPRSYKSTHNVSRHTMVMRKARDDDARRVASQDDGVVVHESDNSPSARLTARGVHTQVIRRAASERTVSGRRVEVRQEGSISGRYSTRLSGKQAASIRVAGGDTIIRYKSGDMVIKRGARRAELRKQVIWTYALGYLLLFGLFIYWLLTGATTITPEEFVDKAFSRRQSAHIIDLERAALEVMRGNRTPAEIRMAQTLTFYDEEKDAVRIEKGSRLTLLTAAKLGHAIIEDQAKPPEKREFREPLKIYRETYLGGINWPHVMTIYNAIGFFLLLGLFLWRPIMHYLGTQGKKTASALKNAREAEEQAADYRDKYRALAGSIEEKGALMTAQAEERLEREREEALVLAKTQAEEISGGIAGALRNEESRLSGSIGAHVAAAACDRAKEILKQRLGQTEHDAAIEELIADIAGMPQAAQERG